MKLRNLKLALLSLAFALPAVAHERYIDWQYLNNPRHQKHDLVDIYGTEDWENNVEVSACGFILNNSPTIQQDNSILDSVETIYRLCNPIENERI